jgi:hypothetical protein
MLEAVCGELYGFIPPPYTSVGCMDEFIGWEAILANDSRISTGLFALCWV